LNKVDHRRPIAADVQLLAETALDGQVIGSVHYDEAVSEAFAHKMLVTEYEPQAQAVRDIESLGGNILRHLKEGSAGGGRSTAAAPGIRATRDL
jgi:MinD-like ATPase involved in chromosome partitioning or flagellar assembly